MSRLLVVEDDPSVRTTVVTFLELEGYAVEAVASTREAIDRLQRDRYPIVLSDIYIDERTGLEVLEAARRQDPDCAVILMTGRGTMETVMRATQRGAFDYIAKPFELDRLLETIKRAEAARQTDTDEEVEVEDLPDTELIGSSAKMVDVFKTLSRVAPTDATVLVEGETGTGKEMIARLTHRFSARAEHPFVAVDCTAIAPALLESELFGSLRGAFTGADRDRLGMFEAAHRGTVFLDEIGDIEMNFQLKLLRFLQEHEIRPVGAAKGKKIDVRVVAATNRDLHKMVEEGKFREDLWYRLNQIMIKLPPLRERHGDIPLLAQYFLKRANERYHQNGRLLESGLKVLEHYTWPGNVRQMQHLIERLSILAPQGRIDQESVEDALSSMESREASGETLAEAETEQIRRVMAATGGNKSRAAKLLGIERKTLYRKLKQLEGS